MTRKLNEPDRAAVDLLLDRAQAGNNGNGGDNVVLMSGPVADERLSAVQKILSVLDQTAAPEPSSDLVVRTLQQIARSDASPTAMPTIPGQFIDPSAPMA